LQLSAGDQNASRAGFSLSRIPVIQPKLTVGASNDPLEREADRIADQVLAAPIFQQGFLCAVGPRVMESGLGMIQGFPYSAPGEDLRLK